MNDFTLPDIFGDIPGEKLTFGLSPIQYLPRMSNDLPGSVHIYAKREDLNSGLAYGGNKVRKLEYLLFDAISQGCDTLVSVGGVQSNHTRQVTAVARSRGMEALTIQNHWVEWKSEGYEKVGNIQLTRLMGGNTIMAPDTFSITESDQDSPVVKETLDRVREHGGGFGSARWTFEVAEHEKQMGVFFDTIVRKLIDIDASAKPEETAQQVLKIAKNTAARIGLSEDDVQPSDINPRVEYAGPAYGIPDTKTAEAIKYGAKMDAFITDPVYEGKTLHGLLDMNHKGDIEGRDVLFAHLGGQVALSAYTNMEDVA